ncbi:MAG: histidine kinase [Erysipelotrichaceae bacterium]|nr:histidine kinase [Erysipelotrichaceae bacterium]
MEKSLIRKMLILISGILISSLLFFIVISATYDSFYRQTVIKDKSQIASAWASSIDNRLNSIYEHLYDVSSVIYRKNEIRSGSPEMDYVNRNSLLDVLETKIMASPDITAIFIVDSESDLFLYNNSGALSIVENNNLKYFVKDYCINNCFSLRNRIWKNIEINDAGYYYNALKLGKYVVGALSRYSLYSVENPSSSSIPIEYNTYILAEDKLSLIHGDPSLIKNIDTNKEEAYLNNGLVVIPTRQKNSDASVYLLAKADGTSPLWSLAPLFLIIDSAATVILTAILIYNTRKRVSAPITELIDANSKLAQGDFDYKLDGKKAGSYEFEGLYSSFNEMSDKIKNLTIEQYDAKIKQQQNQLKMLRAQVKPHTFLNAINTINNMTYTGKPEDIRRYIAAFASFTRYMLYKSKDWTIVEDEIKNINSYVQMQQIRFPESIEIIYDIDPDIYSEQIPYLILFSLVQNSFKHAMTLTDKTYITISGEYYSEEGFDGFRLIEEDNGPGFSKEALKIIETAEADDPNTKEHLGLTNVHYSLNLIYKRDDLLRISNREEGGVHIELLISSKEVEDETFSM